MQLNISLIFCFLFILFSCSSDSNNEIITSLIEKKEIIVEKKQNIIKKIVPENIIEKKVSANINFPVYFVGPSYFLEGIEYTPTEDYTYNQTGLASFYGKELHNKKTANNELNKRLIKNLEQQVEALKKKNQELKKAVAEREDEVGGAETTRICDTIGQLPKRIQNLIFYYTSHPVIEYHSEHFFNFAKPFISNIELTNLNSHNPNKWCNLCGEYLSDDNWKTCNHGTEILNRCKYCKDCLTCELRERH